MTFKRSVSMPEASRLLTSSFPMRVREINDLSPLNELEEFKGSLHESENTTRDPGKDRTEKTLSKFSYNENEGKSQDIMDDDYGFFPMDDADFQDTEPVIQCHTPVEDTSSTTGIDSSEFLDSSYDSSTVRTGRRKRSALKRGSTYGNADEGIPLDFERTEFNRVLPKPDLSQRETVGSLITPKGILRSKGSLGLFRVASEPVFVRPVYQPDTNASEEEIVEHAKSVPSGGFVEGAMKKRISFGTIQIREHAQTIGDNPACSYGTPISLDWDHKDLEEFNLEEYELYRPRQRTKEELHMNHFQRRNLLKLNGYSTDEIKESKKQVAKLRNKRERTRFLAINYPQLGAVEDVIESGFRKVKRSISKSKLASGDDEKTIPKPTSKDDLSLYSSMPKELLLETMYNDASNATAPF